MDKIIDNENMNKARREVELASKAGKRVVVMARSEDFNRKMLENKKVNVLLFRDFSGRDKLKQRNSGLNQVLCKIARDNKIVIGIDFGNLIKNSGKTLAEVLSRVAQNIKLCKKYKVKIEIFNYSKEDIVSIKSFLLTLGADTNMIKKAF